MKQYIVLANSAWRSVPTRTQQLVTRFKDAEVLFFELPREGKKHKEPGRQVRPNVTVYSRPPLPLLPESADFLRRRAMKSACRFQARRRRKSALSGRRGRGGRL